MKRITNRYTALLLIQLADVEAAIDRIRTRHPRGDEETGTLERSDNGYGGCTERNVLSGWTRKSTP